MQRYRLSVDAECSCEPLEPCDHGDWVRHADAEAELAKLRARVSELEVCLADGAGELIAVTVKLERLRDAARRVVETEDALGRLIENPTLAPEDVFHDAMGDAGSAMIALREALKEV